MKIFDLLEGNTQKLFHFTNLRGLEGMIKTGQIQLSTLVGNSSEMYKTKRAFAGAHDKFYFLSTARNRSGDYLVSNMRNGELISALLVIDGRKISSYGKVIPFSFAKMLRGEMEDRFVSDHGSISISDVVDSIDIYVPAGFIERIEEMRSHGGIDFHSIEGQEFELLKSAKDAFSNVRFFDNKQKFVRGVGNIEINFEGVNVGQSVHKDDEDDPYLNVLINYLRHGNKFTNSDLELLANHKHNVFESMINTSDFILSDVKNTNPLKSKLLYLIRKKYHDPNDFLYVRNFANEVVEQVKKFKSGEDR